MRRELERLDQATRGSNLREVLRTFERDPDFPGLIPWVPTGGAALLSRMDPALSGEKKRAPWFDLA